MDIGMIGLGKMGFNMTLRLMQGGHRVVAFDRAAATVADAKSRGATPAGRVEDVVAQLAAPRAVWAMVPAGAPVDELVGTLSNLLQPGDVFVDGGNSNFHDSRRRHDALASRGIQFVDAGVSGGVWGLEVGYCMMLGGADAAIAVLKPALDTLAPPEGWRHVGGPGAGHFAKMVHNGIEYGLMQSYAEGFDLLQASEFSYDLAGLAHLWNQGSVVRSWLLELAERAFDQDPKLQRIEGWVEDSGEGRWTVLEAMDRSIPTPVLALALMTRFASRQPNSFRDRVLAALRHQFGGHAVKPAVADGAAAPTGKA